MSRVSNQHEMLSFVRSVNFPYYPGAIFPCEMAYFLQECEDVGIDCIIESGRGEGYSTAVLAVYGEARKVRVISIDMEDDASRAEACRRRLTRYPDLELVVGDTFYELPKLLRSATGPIALLIDGPKYDEAIYLSAAAAAFSSVRVIAHHNTGPETSWYGHFVKRFPQAQRLEDSEMFCSVQFAEFRTWEREFTENYTNVGRDLECTSLILSVLAQTGPDGTYLNGPSLLHTWKARILYWWWKLGCPIWSMIRFAVRLKNWLKAKLRLL